MMVQIEEAERRKNANKINQKAALLLEAGKLDEAESTLRSLLPYEDNPTRIEEALKGLSVLRSQEAETRLRETETQKMDEAAKMRKNVMAFMREAAFDKAEGELRALLALTPDDNLERLLTDMPEVRHKHQMSADAASEVENLAKAGKTFEKAQELFATGRFDESAKHLRKAIALDPSNEKAVRLLRRVFEIDHSAVSQSSPSRTKLDAYGQIVDGG